MLTGPEPRIGRYDASAPLRVWLRVIAVGVALNLLEAKGRRGRTRRGAQPSLPGPVPADADLVAVKARYAPAFQRALETTILALDPRDKNLLWFHFVEG